MASGAEPAEAVVIGLGNLLRGDDGAGIAAVRLLAHGGAAAGVRCREHEGEPLGLLELWEGAARAVVLDAVRTGAPAGTLHRIDAAAGPLPAPLGAAGTHAVGLAEAVELGRVLGRLPGELVILGVEGEDFSTGAPLSAPVQAAVGALARAALAELAQSAAERLPPALR